LLLFGLFVLDEGEGRQGGRWCWGWRREGK
jgi:hypothetical protein